MNKLLTQDALISDQCGGKSPGTLFRVTRALRPYHRVLNG